ncbi:hypothetical protein N5I87_15485 [Ralstonia sp. CHL-2022]|uniref:AbiEi antitoxin C-terminal domain-containing protein n=1 Tax=Ralstonia mojiangensis TaxID=2953895 RepID=A0AAE3I4U1_9RALS|nr:hypothetical protein [Ralstonia mojiangensis]MCT7317410.1 hypothetical protein [Ralstonia mojiangensis]
MNRSRLQIAKSDIVKYFNELPSPVLKLRQIQSILAEQRAFWRLAQNTSASDFIAFLKQHAKLRKLEFPFPQRAETLYVWGEPPFSIVLLGLRKQAYFSHYTAMRMLGLTEQTPTTVYLTEERAKAVAQTSVKLTQLDIEQAFARPPRVSQNFVTFEGRKIYLLNGAYTNGLGVLTERITDDGGQEVDARLTNLERTLIDATVRPVYAGGVYEVAKAFALASDRLSVNKLITMLRKLGFAYPYHQAIGYYLERAGYRAAQLDLVRRLPIEQDFYLAHDMGRMHYVANWRLFVPEGF